MQPHSEAAKPVLACMYLLGGARLTSAEQAMDPASNT